MSNTILLTTNLPLQFIPYKLYDLEQLKASIEKFGYTPKLITPKEMSIPLEEVPLAAINCTGYPVDSHLRFLRDLELKGVKVPNLVFNAKVADDKMLSFIEMSNAGIPVPKSIDLNLGYGTEFANILSMIDRTLGFPVVVKVPNSALGYGVHLVHTVEQLDELMNLVALSNLRNTLGHMTTNLLIQQYIPETKGSAVRVVVINKKCVGAYKRTNKHSWKTTQSSKTWGFGIGGKNEDLRIPYQVTKEIEDLCLNVCDVLNLNFAGIDLLFGPNGFLVGEVNTSPNHEPFDNTHPDINLSDSLIKYLTTEQV